MTATKYSMSREVHVKVRRLQVKLWCCAKRNEGRRFHALYDRIHSKPILQEAWCRVRRNGGASGIDGRTLRDVEAGGVDEFLKGIEESLREGSYRPLPVRRVMIPKRSGDGERPLGIPVIRDRVVQMAASLVLTPIFEADFRECSFGYRPKRNTTGALERIRTWANRGYNHVVDADIKSFFTRIDHDLLEELVARRISDRRVQKLIRQWLKSGVMEEGVYSKTEVGTPQGGVISPLLSNVMLNELDKAWETTHKTWGKLTRFCDDFVIQCLSRKQAEIVLKKAEAILRGLKLEIHPEKTRIVDLSWGKEKMTFLGHTLKKMASYRFAGKMYLNRWPSRESMKAVRTKVQEITRRGRFGVKNVRVLVPELNRVLQGWGNHFRSGNANKAFTQIDRYVHCRLALFENRRRGRPNPHWLREFTYEWYSSLGVYHLIGTVRYPNPSLVLVKANA
jgi:RNA-directed DNA polymerase